MSACPCGSSLTFASCCEPYLKGTKLAPTAEALMRSRYTAYTRHNVDYLLQTYDPLQQYLFDRETTLEWARRSRWLGLEIKASHQGSPSDTNGTIEFIARYERAGETHSHHEVSIFQKYNGEWYYIEGQYPSASALLGAESKRLKT